MTIDEARSLAEHHLGRFPQLSGWRIEFSSKARRRLGVCRYRQRTIVLTSSFVLANSRAKVREVTLHELAHALVGKGHGHDRVWQAKARELGVPPVRFCSSVVMPPGDWQATCGGCSRHFSLYGRPTRPRFCRQCGREAGQLQFVRVGSDRTPNLFSNI